MPKQDLRATYLRSNLIISCNLHYIVSKPTVNFVQSVEFTNQPCPWNHLLIPFNHLTCPKTQQYLCMNKTRGWRANHRIASCNMKLQSRYIGLNFWYSNFYIATKTCVPKMLEGICGNPTIWNKRSVFWQTLSFLLPCGCCVQILPSNVAQRTEIDYELSK